MIKGSLMANYMKNVDKIIIFVCLGIIIVLTIMYVLLQEMSEAALICGENCTAIG